MKLKEFLEVALLSKKSSTKLTESFVDETCLYGNELDKYKNIIKECDEFAKCDSLDILTMPFVKGKYDGKIYTSNTIKLSDLMEFKGRCYLLSLGLTPEMYDPNQLLKPVKNGAAIGPTIYDPTDFTPRKHISLTWSPEMVQDILNIDTEQEQRQILHNLLNDVLDNPEEYKTKGIRGVLVRGLFEVIDNNDGADVISNVYDVDLTVSKPEYVGYKVFYLETNVITPGEIELKLNSRIIPSHLKDKFIDEFGTDPTIITEKIIDDFLENQGLNRYTGRLAEILKKGKEVNDKISEMERTDNELKKMMKLKKESKK